MSNRIAKINPLMLPVHYGDEVYFTSHYFHAQYLANKPEGAKYKQLPHFNRLIKSLETYSDYVSRNDIVELEWGLITDPDFGSVDHLFKETRKKPIMLISATAQIALTHHLDDEISRQASVNVNAKAAQPLDTHAALSDPATLRSMLLSYTEKVITLEAKVQEQAPKVEFHDAVTKAVNCQTVQQAAKTLNIGPNKLFEFLRKERILMNSNLPYQQFINDKHFRVVNKPYTDRRGEQRISTRTLVTGKGLVLIQKRLASAIVRARLREIAAML